MLFSWHLREDVIVSLVQIMGIVWVLIGLSSRNRWLWWNLIMMAWQMIVVFSGGEGCTLAKSGRD